MGQVTGWIASGLSAHGKRDAADRSAGAHEYQAAVARNNAVIAEQNAEYAEQKGVAREGISRERTQQLIGTQRTHIAAGNIDAGSGSALRIQEDASRLGEVDALTQRNNAAREAYDWRTKGTNQTAQANLYSWLAPQERHAGNVAFWSTVIGGLGGGSSGGSGSPGGGGDMGGGGGASGASEMGDWEEAAAIFA